MNILPKRVWVNATQEQMVSSKPLPKENAPTASIGIPTKIIKRSLTIKLIRIKFSFVFLAYIKRYRIRKSGNSI